MGKHTKQGRHSTQPRRTIGMVDTTTGTAHLLSIAAAENGLPGGRYTALPAALVAREARHCRWCAPIPTQRSRGSRR